MYRIAVAPTHVDGVLTLFAQTEEWLRFIERLRTSQMSPMAQVLLGQIDQNQPTNSVTLPEARARQLLHLAGLVA